MKKTKTSLSDVNEAALAVLKEGVKNNNMASIKFGSTILQAIAEFCQSEKDRKMQPHTHIR